MFFVLLFATSILIVPFMLDKRSHGTDNIFRRSGRELSNYHAVELTLSTVRAVPRRLNDAFVIALFIAIGLVVFAIALFVVFQLISFVIFLLVVLWRLF